MRVWRMVLLMAMGALLTGFSEQESIGQPMDERKAQDALPQSDDAMWAVLGQCPVKLDMKKYKYSIRITPEVRAKQTTILTIRGFMMPLEATEMFSHFLLSKRTPTCGFCPPGEPNEVVEVWTQTPVAWSDGLVAVTGEFALTNNPDLGLFFQLKKARVAVQ